MKKYFIFTFMLLIAILSAFKVTKTDALEEYNYSYKITSNSNSIDDLLLLYEVKEFLVISYNNALENELIIEEVYPSFSYYKVELVDNVFNIIIKEGKGITLEGKLKTSVCDEYTLNNRYALLEWLSNLK